MHAYRLRVVAPVQDHSESARMEFLEFGLAYYAHVMGRVSGPMSETEYLSGKKSSMVQRFMKGKQRVLLSGDDSDRSGDCIVKCESRPGCKDKDRLIVVIHCVLLYLFGPHLAPVATLLHAVMGCAMDWTLDQINLAIHLLITTTAANRSSDYDRFDSCIDEFLMMFARKVYEMLGVDKRVTEKVYRQSVSWKVRSSRTGFAFKVWGHCRQSGSPETSVGNNLIALWAHKWATVHHVIGSGRLTATEFLANPSVVDSLVTMVHVGDDNISGWPNPLDMPPLDAVEQVGLKLKVGGPGEFIRCRFYESSDHTDFGLVRDSVEVMHRLPFTLNAPIQITFPFSKFFAAKLHAYGRLVGRDPIWWVYVPRMLALIGDVDWHGVDLEHESYFLTHFATGAEVYSEPSTERRLFVQATFGLSVAVQLQLERDIRGCTCLDTIFTSPQVSSIVLERFGCVNPEPQGWPPIR